MKFSLSKAKKVLYKTRGVRSKFYPEGKQRGFYFDAHMKALELPKGSFRSKTLKKTRSKISSIERQEKNLFKKLKLKGR
tara:strand:- start:318 stop:554 length:237 start_codon:yes stop_codon:yes gene_type:complete